MDLPLLGTLSIACLVNHHSSQFLPKSFRGGVNNEGVDLPLDVSRKASHPQAHELSIFPKTFSFDCDYSFTASLYPPRHTA